MFHQNLDKAPKSLFFLNITFCEIRLPISLCKTPKFPLIPQCENSVERQSFRIVSGDLPETVRNLRLSTKLPHREIRWNYGILHTVSQVLKKETGANFN